MRLTRLFRAAGCAGKLAPQDLDRAIRTIPRPTRPEVIVGYDNSDDAGVYQITPDVILVQTVDFFSSVVDGPLHLWSDCRGECDVHPVGGQPRRAIVCFPLTALISIC
jgi:selenide,water dikinase